MNAVFADTSFFLALLHQGDPLHIRAIDEWKVNRSVLTTEFVVLELGNACARAVDHADFLALGRNSDQFSDHDHSSGLSSARSWP